MILISRLDKSEKDPRGGFKVTYCPPEQPHAAICSTLRSMSALRNFLLRSLQVEASKAEEGLVKLECNGRAEID